MAHDSPVPLHGVSGLIPSHPPHPHPHPLLFPLDAQRPPAPRGPPLPPPSSAAAFLARAALGTSAKRPRHFLPYTRAVAAAWDYALATRRAALRAAAAPAPAAATTPEHPLAGCLAPVPDPSHGELWTIPASLPDQAAAHARDNRFFLLDLATHTNPFLPDSPPATPAPDPDPDLPVHAVASSSPNSGAQPGNQSSTAPAKAGNLIPPEWQPGGSMAHLASRAEASHASATTPSTGGAQASAVGIFEDPDEAYKVWCEVWGHWRAANPGAPVVPGDGFGFLRNRRLQNWAQKQRARARKGGLAPRREKMLRDVGFFDDPVPQQQGGGTPNPQGGASPQAHTPAVVLPDTWTGSGPHAALAQAVESSAGPIGDLLGPGAFGVYCRVWEDFVRANGAHVQVPRDGAAFLKGGVLRRWYDEQLARRAGGEMHPEEVDQWDAVETMGESRRVRDSLGDRVVHKNGTKNGSSPVTPAASKYVNNHMSAAQSPVEGINMPDQWIDGELSDLARRADEAAQMGDVFRLSPDPSEAFRLWCQILQSFVEAGNSPARIPVNGYGFLRSRRLYDWVSRQRRKCVMGEVPKDKMDALVVAGLDLPLASADRDTPSSSHQRQENPPEVVIPDSWRSGELSELARKAERATAVGETFRAAPDATASFQVWCEILRSFIRANPDWKGPVPGNGFGFLRSKRLYDWVIKQRKKATTGKLPPHKVAMLRSCGLVFECPQSDGPAETKHSALDAERSSSLQPLSISALVDDRFDEKVDIDGENALSKERDLPVADDVVNIPESWQTGTYRDLAKKADKWEIGMGPFRIASNPANSFEAWADIFKTFVDANPGRASRIPGTGYGFLRNRRLYDWARSQERKLLAKTQSDDRIAKLREVGFELDVRQDGGEGRSDGATESEGSGDDGPVQPASRPTRMSDPSPTSVLQATGRDSKVHEAPGSAGGERRSERASKRQRR